MVYSNTTVINDKISPIIIDPVLIDILLIVNLVCLADIVGIFGIVANIINIRVFQRLGYRDGVNVTLTFLAISDAGALVVQQCYNVLVLPAITDADLVIVKSNLNTELLFLNAYFIRVSCLITALASFERCLCVVLPLKVKRLFTAKVAIATNVTVFVVLTMYVFPVFYAYYVEWAFVPALNRTILSPFRRADGENVLRVSYYFTDLLLPYTTFFILIVSSAAIYIKLKSVERWRLSNSSSGIQSLNSKRERKNGVMLMTMSVICVSFVLPKSALFTALGVVRELKTRGAYQDITTVVISFTTLLESVNCSVTIFVYYRMSTKYRAEFNNMFHKVMTSFVVKHHLPTSRRFG